MLAWFDSDAFVQVSGLFGIRICSARTASYRHILVDSLEILLELVLYACERVTWQHGPRRVVGYSIADHELHC